MSIVEIIPEQDPDLAPLPELDELGLGFDSIYLATRATETGKEFVLVHSRPFSGQALDYFLNNSAPFKYLHTERGDSTRNSYSRLDPENVGEDDFEQHLFRLHSRVGKYGVGAALLAFYKEVYPGWAAAFGDPSTDSVYFPLNQTQVYSDFRAYAPWQMEQWKERMPREPEWRGADSIYKLIKRIAPTEKLESMNEDYRSRRHQAWQRRDDDPGGSIAAMKKAYARFGQDLSDYLDNLSDGDADSLVGNALAYLPYAHEGSDNHTLARRLVIDMAGQRYWLEMPYVYDPKVGSTDELQFPEPSITFNGNTVTVSDDNGTFIELEPQSKVDDSLPLAWRIRSYNLPSSNYVDGRFLTVAWRQTADGQRQFLNQADTVEAVRVAGIPIAGTPDTYLGKLLVRRFRQPGEYEESLAERKWLTEMSLPGSDSKRRISDRELPVWIQLPQHQPDLLNSKFLRAAERLATA